MGIFREAMARATASAMTAAGKLAQKKTNGCVSPGKPWSGYNQLTPSQVFDAGNTDVPLPFLLPH